MATEKQREYNRKYMHKYYHEHRDKINKNRRDNWVNHLQLKKTRKIYKENNRSKINESKRISWKKNKVHINILRRKTYALSPQLKEQNHKRRKAWNKQHPLRYLRRRKCVVHTFTQQQWKEKCDATKRICPGCNHPFIPRDPLYKLTIDHVYPLSLAEKDFLATGVKRIYTIGDVQPLCFSCNCSKQDKLVSQISTKAVIALEH